MRRPVDTLILCEDRDHESFLRRVLKESGLGRVYDGGLNMAPSGGGDAKQYVNKAFPEEVKKMTKRGRLAKLLVMVDADNLPCKERKENVVNGTSFSEDHVAFLLPKWAIQTWVLNFAKRHKEETDNINDSDKRIAKPHFRDAARQFVECMRDPSKVPDHLPCLKEGVEEFRRVFPSESTRK